MVDQVRQGRTVPGARGIRFRDYSLIVTSLRFPTLQRAWTAGRPYMDHWLKRGAYEVARRLTAGSAVECPCCSGRFRRFLPFRPGNWRTEAVRCPGCGAFQRQRVLWLYLMRETGLLDPPARVLHFAPEWALYRVLSQRPGVTYQPADLQPSPMVPVSVDITRIPFATGAFDVVLCSHVLEHVPADTAAMAEIRRVLAPAGTAVLQHPIDADRATTHENPAVTTPRDRRQAFGQADHVRLYGRDFDDRLRAAGFELNVVRYADELDSEEVRRYGLRDTGALRSQDLYICRHVDPAPDEPGGQS